MGISQNIMVDVRGAAKLMDMRTEEFLALVETGVLPRAKRLGSLERWSVDDLRAIATGELVDKSRMEW